MCNTRSNIYLQSMKTYTLSVNTLMRNLTSERHDNCAPCLGLILPIRWVTPPPNVLFEVFHSWRYLAMSSHLVWLQSQHVFMIIFTMLIIYILVFCPLQHSLIAMSSCWIFWSKWMWSDPNLSMLLPQLYLSKSYAFYWKLSIVFTETLSAEVNLTNIYICF